VSIMLRLGTLEKNLLILSGLEFGTKRITSIVIAGDRESIRGGLSIYKVLKYASLPA